MPRSFTVAEMAQEAAKLRERARMYRGASYLASADALDLRASRLEQTAEYLAAKVAEAACAHVRRHGA